jgi:hypothetical protein
MNPTSQECLVFRKPDTSGLAICQLVSSMNREAFSASSRSNPCP